MPAAAFVLPPDFCGLPPLPSGLPPQVATASDTAGSDAVASAVSGSHVSLGNTGLLLLLPCCNRLLAGKEMSWIAPTSDIFAPLLFVVLFFHG